MGATTGSGDILDESHAVEISGKIMVAAVIILFMVVVFVLLLHLHSLCFMRCLEEEETTAPPPLVRRLRRRRRRFVFAPGQDPVIYGIDHQVGLDPSVLRSLPVLVFQPQEFKDGLDCAVCLSELVEGEKARILPKCNHGFHVDCIDMWFQSHSTCPLCRTPVTSESPKPTSSSSSAEESVSGNSESSEAENSASMSSIESSNFPTHVLVWGDQTQFSSVSVPLEEDTSEEPPCFSTSGSCSSGSDSSSDGTSSDSRCHGMLVIDIPSEVASSSCSPSDSRCAEDEMKSPMSARLRSLKRLLSRDKKSCPCSPNSIEVEKAQS